MIERLAEALKIESWHLFKNEPISISSKVSATGLLPTQKKEILKMANLALAKILGPY
jgi:hypothetical protein